MSQRDIDDRPRVSPPYAVLVTSLAAFLVLFLICREPGVWYTVEADVVVATAAGAAPSDAILDRQRFASLMVERLKDSAFIGRSLLTAGMVTDIADERTLQLSQNIAQRVSIREHTFDGAHRITIGLRSQNSNAALSLTDYLAKELVHEVVDPGARHDLTQLQDRVDIAHAELARQHHELDQFAASVFGRDGSSELAFADATESNRIDLSAEVSDADAWTDLTEQSQAIVTMPLRADLAISSEDRDQFRQLQANCAVAANNLASSLRDFKAAGKTLAHDQVSSVLVAKPASIVDQRGGSVATRQLAGLGLMAYLVGVSVLFLQPTTGRDELLETTDQVVKFSPVPVIAAVYERSGRATLADQRSHRRIVRRAVRAAEFAIMLAFLAIVVYAFGEKSFPQRFAQDPFAAYGEVFSQFTRMLSLVRA